MTRVTYIEHNGTHHVVDAAVGSTVMQAAIDNLVPGIDADCGGQCACATCHVFVQADWLSVVGTAVANEDAMLRLNDSRANNSRLSCQIILTDAHDGLVVTLPEFQF